MYNLFYKNFHYWILLALIFPFLSNCAKKQPISMSASPHASVTKSKEEVVQKYRTSAEKRLKPYFRHAKISYPPKEIAIITYKESALTELWARENQCWSLIKKYPLEATSGTLGPKLRERDLQIPEGIYQIVHLNPNSQFHLSMMLNYPNSFDLEKAREDNRSNPGSDIFIHGYAFSRGCIAISNKAIEELFILVDTVGKHRAQVITLPYDFRTKKNIYIPSTAPKWTDDLYKELSITFKNVTQSC